MRVMQVDHERMSVPERPVRMGMRMRLRPFPTLVHVPMVFVVNMKMFVAQWFMGMLKNERISGRPKPPRRKT